MGFRPVGKTKNTSILMKGGISEKKKKRFYFIGLLFCFSKILGITFKPEKSFKRVTYRRGSLKWNHFGLSGSNNKIINMSNQQTNKYTNQDPKWHLTLKVAVKNTAFHSQAFFNWRNLIWPGQRNAAEPWWCWEAARSGCPCTSAMYSAHRQGQFW